MVRREHEGGLLLISQTAHAWVAGQLALRWGNGQFTRPEPWDELILTATQHDNGWAEWELAPRIHADGRPVSFMEMELEEHFAIWQRSAERMQATSLYGALLISMHATSLYVRRLDDNARGDTPEIRQKIRDFVADQRAFQERLWEKLVDHPRLGATVTNEHLDDALRWLQIWDLLSLTLLMGPLSADEVEDVPVGAGRRATIQLVPDGDRTLTFKPYPFCKAPFTVQVDGRWLAQKRFGHNVLFRQALDNAQILSLTFTIDKHH